jgi:uncharacterized sulfatase
VRRFLTVLVVLVLALAAGGYLCRDTLLLYAPGIIDGIANPIGPNQPVAWQDGPASAAAAPGARPPNVVLIVADDLGWNDVSLHGGGVGGGQVKTPNIDAIAQQGVHFTNGYSGAASCAPSRAALMSGRYGTRFGFEFTPVLPRMAPIIVSLDRKRADRLRHASYTPSATPAPSFAEMGMPAEEVTLAETLAKAGYHTGHIGKWHLGGTNGMGPWQQGFAESLEMASQLYLPVDDPGVVNAPQPNDPIDGYLWPNSKYAVRWNGGPRFAPKGYLTDYFSENAVTFIEKNRNRPFFLYLAYWGVHTPLQALHSDYDAFPEIADHTERVYAGMMRSLDRGIGQVLQALDEHGLAENTLVIFTSDNGGPGYISLKDVNHPYRGWKLSYFEGGIHVPVHARWSARIPAGAVVREPVHHFDLYATAAAAAGTPLPSDRTMDGVDLLPWARGEAQGAPHEALFWRQGHNHVVISGGWKWFRAGVPDRAWLWHLADDPTERNDLIDANPEKAAELAAIFDAWNAEQHAPLWPSETEAPVSIDKTISEPESPDDVWVSYPN